MHRALSRQFGFTLRSKNVIAPTKGYFPKMTRAELEQKITKPNLAEEMAEQARKEVQEDIENFHLNLVQNDSNPVNFLTNLQIKTPEELKDLHNLNANFDEAESKKVAPLTSLNPDIIVYRKDPPAPSIAGRLGRVKGSVKKIKPVMKKIRGLHINDAMQTMEKTQKRSANRIYAALKMVKAHAANKGYDIMRLYVKDAITNRQKRIKGVRYHAKMKRGLMTRDWCSLLIRLEERPIRSFFKDFVSGKCPKGVAKMWKAKIIQSENSFAQIRKYQFILTAKGRHQRKEMIRRKAYSLQQQLAVKFVYAEKRMLYSFGTTSDESNRRGGCCV